MKIHVELYCWNCNHEQHIYSDNDEIDYPDMYECNHCTSKKMGLLSVEVILGSPLPKEIEKCDV